MIAAKKAAEIAAKLAKSAAEAAKALYAAIIAGGAASILVIVIVVLIGCGAAIFGSQDESTETLPLSAEVESYEPVIRKYAKQHGIPDYVLLIQAVMMQESGGRGNDPMQASECGYNTQYPRTPGGITDPEYSIAVGIHSLADCLQTAGAESPIDLDHIQLALQGYNFGSGYITWALQKYGEYSRANAIEFSLKMAEQMGWNSYGDKQYVPHVLRYYPIGKVFYTPEDGDAIVDVALTQVGNVGGEPYWSWYGFSNHVEWCACFVSWCADQCGYLDSGTYPKFSGCVFGMQWFQQRGLWLDGSAEPTPGMLIFFDWATQDGVPDHVGIVEKVENGIVYTVEGNSRDMCRQKQYSLGNSVILNFINSMTTSILSRYREIAMLQSVGMTGRQVKQMLIYEGIGYSILGLFGSLILSVIASLTVVRMMGAELTYFTWHFTLLPVFLCIIPLILITAIVPLVCYNKMAQKTVVERLRIAE